MPLKKEILIQYGQNIALEHYADFLIGITWDPDMLEINYGDVVQDLYDYIVEVGYINWKKENIFLFNGVGGKRISGHREFSILVIKCMVLNVPFMKGKAIGQLWLMLDQNLFNEGRRPNSPSDFLFGENQFIVVRYYSNQISGNIVKGVRTWPFGDEKSIKII